MLEKILKNLHNQVFIDALELQLISRDRLAAQFSAQKPFDKSSGGSASLKSGAKQDKKLRGKDYILIRMEEGELDWLDFDQFDPEDPDVVKKLKSIIKK